MPKYKMTIIQGYRVYFDVEADSAQDAVDKVEKLYDENSGDLEIIAGDYGETDHDTEVYATDYDDRLLNTVLSQMKKDFEDGDLTAIAELLSFIDKAKLSGYLPEE